MSSSIRQHNFRQHSFRLLFSNLKKSRKYKFYVEILNLEIFLQSLSNITTNLLLAPNITSQYLKKN